MKLYIHKDTFYPDTWWVKFKWLLDKRYKDIDYEIVNLHFENNINDLQLGNDDWCICRFAHYEEDFELSKRVYPILHEKFKGRIWPSKEDWYYYNDKQRQLEFFKENNIPHPISHYSYGRDDFLEWVNENNLEYPIVVKKSQGAGSEKVNLIKKWKEVDFPVIAQEYIDVDYDIRIAFINNKVLFLKRFHQWKTKNKDNFPYGTEKYSTDIQLRKRLAEYKPAKAQSLSKEEIFQLKPIVEYLKNLINTKTIAWDIIGNKDNFKVLEFSYLFHNELFDCKYYYDIVKEDIFSLEYDRKIEYTFIQNEILSSVK